MRKGKVRDRRHLLSGTKALGAPEASSTAAGLAEGELISPVESSLPLSEELVLPRTVPRGSWHRLAARALPFGHASSSGTPKGEPRLENGAVACCLLQVELGNASTETVPSRLLVF